MPVFDKQAVEEEELLKRLPYANLSGEEPEEANSTFSIIFSLPENFLDSILRTISCAYTIFC